MGMDELNQEIDNLIDDIHNLIDDEETAAEELPDLTDFLGEEFEGEPVLPEEELPDLTPYLGEEFAEEEPVPEQVQEVPHSHWTKTQKLPKHVAKLQQNQEQAYAEWLYAQDHRETPHTVSEQEEEPKEKKRHGFRNFVIVLLVLALMALAAAVFILPKQPVAETGLGARRSGVSTILLAGTDQDGLRTDTLMLLTVDRSKGSLSLVSIPRDTLVNGGYSVPKINTVYAANNGGAEGIEMLMTRVAECIGFRPDGYMLIRLEAFVELVDQLGGVKFHVPVDMFYNDPAQDLYIDLKAGLQTLDGQQAMGVVRFRSGYADADLGRISVQRDLLSALVEQMVSFEGVTKSPQLLNILMEHTDSSLTVANYLWLAEAALVCDLRQVQTATLPGTPKDLGGSYYVLDPQLVAQTVNTYCNPYETAVTPEHLNIRQG